MQRFRAEQRLKFKQNEDAYRTALIQQDQERREARERAEAAKAAEEVCLGHMDA